MGKYQVGIILEPRNIDEEYKYKLYNWSFEEFKKADAKFLKNAKELQKENLSIKYVKSNGKYILSFIVPTDQRDNWNRVLPVKILISLSNLKGINIQEIENYFNDFSKEFNVKFQFDSLIIKEICEEIDRNEFIINTIKIGGAIGGSLIIALFLYYWFIHK